MSSRVYQDLAGRWLRLLLRSPRLRPLRFALTGGTAGLVQLGLLRGFEVIGLAALPANGLAFLLAAQLNFLLSQAFTGPTGRRSRR